MRNPDLKPQSDGKFHVSGNFFVQFQVIGEDADEIETFAFSVGLPPSMPEAICESPVWPSGLMLEAYKVDMDKEDGFFILMNTNGQTTPQGVDLTVAVHAYDGSGTEVARFWGTAIVESCPGPGPGGCASPEDKMQPWPILLPGDGSTRLVDGFTVEFAEELSDLRVFLNAEDVTDQLEEWEGREWDADSFYDYGPAGIFATVAPMCTLPEPIHNCVQSPGPAFQWTQRAINDEDVVRIEAVDLAGNAVQKELHVGSSVAGGTISDGKPILTMTFDEDQIIVGPGQTAVFQARMENTGGGEGHPQVSAEVPEGWEFEWIPGHKPVPAASEETQELNVVVPLDAATGIYPVNATVSYRHGQEDRFLKSQLTVLVEGGRAVENETTDAGDPGQKKESPGAGLLVLPVLAAIALRRRS